MADVTQPTLTTDPSNPVLYTIKNLRTGKYATYTGASSQLSQEAVIGKASLWFFEKNGDGVNIIPAKDPSVKLVTHSSANETGAVWYLVENPYKSGYFCVSLSNTASNNCWDDQGNQTKIGYWQPSANDNEGTSWIIEPFNIKNPIEVTYEVYDGETKLSSTTTLQEANSEVAIPVSITGMMYNGGYQPYALYTYTPEGTIGNQDCTIKVTRTITSGLVHALTDLSNEKAYTIRCDRGALLTTGTTIASTSHKSHHNDAAANFAIISYEEHYYIYSVADKKFVKNNGSLAEMPTNGVYDAIQMEAKTDPYFLYTFKIDDKTTYGLNTNGTGALDGCVINSWTNPDPGDQYYMIEAADFDPEEALAALKDFFHPTYFVTYVVKDEAGNELFKSDAVPTRKGAKITTIPADYRLPFTKYSDADVTIAEEKTTVEFTASWDGPFQVSTSEADAKWYNMTIRSDYSVFVGATEPYYPKASANAQKIADEYQWAFAGNAYAGIMVFNKAKGIKYTLTKDGNNAVMREGQYVWTIGKNGDGFTLKEVGTDYNCINQNGGNEGPLSFWNSAGSLGDNGSTFRISAVPTSIEWTVGEAGYATMYVPGNVNVVGDTSLPKAVGAWTFDDPDNLLAGTGIATMEAAKHEKNKVEVTTPADANIVAVSGPAKGKGAISVPVGSSLKMTTNIDATSLDNYTFMMDIKLADVEKYTSLYQSNVNNSNDGELFVNKGKLGVNYNGVGYGGNVVANTWHRVVFVAEGALPTVYLDGVQVGKANKADGRWSMDPTTLFFADEDGEETDVIASELRFWDVAMTADQVAKLGVAGTNVPEPTGAIAYMGKVTDESLKLQEVGDVVPAGTPVVIKAAPGTYTFAVDNSLLSCAKAVELTTALEDNTLSEEDFSVVGYITDDTDGKISKDQQTFWMADTKDGGKVFEAFWANIPDPTTPLVDGQKVIITGKLQKYVNKSGVVTCEIKNASVAVLDNDLVGTYEEIDAVGKYVLAKPEGKWAGFYKAKGGKIAANKAFLELREGSEIKAFYFDVPENETAIENIAVEKDAKVSEGIYNLSGQRVNKAQKGIYIVNGKKVLF